MPLSEIPTLSEGAGDSFYWTEEVEALERRWTVCQCSAGPPLGFYRPPLSSPLWSRGRVQREASMQIELSPGADSAAGSRWKRAGQVVAVDVAEWRV
jgi:hypothetical protein